MAFKRKGSEKVQATEKKLNRKLFNYIIMMITFVIIMYYIESKACNSVLLDLKWLNTPLRYHTII